MHGLEAALSSSVLLGNGSVSGAVASSASAKASACAGELTLLAGQLQAGCRALYAYRGVTRNIQEARGDVDAARLSGTWMQVLLPELRKVAAACATAADAQAVLMRLLASGGCGVSASTSSGNRSMATAKTSNEAHAAAAAASSSGHGWLPPNVSAAAMQVVDGLVVMDTLLNSKQTILVDLRWFQSALELQRQSTAMHPDGSVSPSLGPSPMAMHGAITAEADAVCAQLLPLLSRPWPLVHSLSSSIAALPPVLAPTVGRVLAHWLEHACSLALGRVPTDAYAHKQGGVRVVTALLVLLSMPSVAAGEAAMKAVRAIGNLGQPGSGVSGARVIERCLECVEKNRVLHTIGDAFMEPATLLRISPYFVQHFNNKRTNANSSNNSSNSKAPTAAGGAGAGSGGGGDFSGDGVLTEYALLSKRARDAIAAQNVMRGSEVYVRDCHDRIMWRIVRAKQFMDASAAGQQPSSGSIVATAGASGASGATDAMNDRDVLHVSVESLRLMNEWTGKVLRSIAYKRAQWAAEKLSSDATSRQWGADGNADVGVPSPSASSSSNLRGGQTGSTSGHSNASELIDGEEMIALFHVITYIKGLSSNFVDQRQRWLKHNVRAIVKEVHQFVNGSLNAIVGARANKRKIGSAAAKTAKVVGDLVGRIKGAFNTVVNVDSSFNSNTTANIDRLDVIEVAPSRLYPVLLSLQCLLWELVSVTTSSSSSAGLASSSATNAFFTQQGIRDIGDFIKRLDTFVVCIDLDRNVTRASSLHDLWFREMYIEHRYAAISRYHQ